MTAPHVLLVSTDDGWTTGDGRWLIEPLNVDPADRRRVIGRSRWKVTDTSGRASFPLNRDHAIVDRLYQAQDLITGILAEEAQAVPTDEQIDELDKRVGDLRLTAQVLEIDYTVTQEAHYAVAEKLAEVRAELRTAVLALREARASHELASQ